MVYFIACWLVDWFRALYVQWTLISPSRWRSNFLYKNWNANCSPYEATMEMTFVGQSHRLLLEWTFLRVFFGSSLQVKIINFASVLFWWLRKTEKKWQIWSLPETRLHVVQKQGLTTENFEILGGQILYYNFFNTYRFAYIDPSYTTAEPFQIPEGTRIILLSIFTVLYLLQNLCLRPGSFFNYGWWYYNYQS